MHSIERRVHAVRSRQQWQWIWLCVSRGLVAGGVLGCAVAFVRGMTDAAFSPLWIVAAALAGPLLGALYAQIRSRSLDAAATAIDHSGNLKDRAQTALRFLAQPDADHPLRRLVIADTDSHLAAVDPASVAPLKTPHACLWGAALCAAALIGTLWTGPGDDLLGALPVDDVVVAQAARLEDGLEELRQFQAEEDQADVDRLIRQLVQQIEALKTPMLKTGPQIDLTGQQSADGDSDVETVQGGEQQEEALRQYRQNLEQYEALRESVLENEAIPLGHRQTIRRYFELIRPESTDAEP